MKTSLLAAPVAIAAVVMGLAASDADADVPTTEKIGERAGAVSSEPSGADSDPVVDKVLAGWGERPRLAAAQMMAKYGQPQEVTSEQLVWRNAGPFKRIVANRTEIPHDFPKPHMDFLRHTIDYRVPPARASSLAAFDGALTWDRNAGELSAQCDTESHNLLALNLANEIVTGKRDVDGARKAFNQAITADLLGNNPPLLASLQFATPKAGAGDPDVVTLPGAPRRPGGRHAKADEGKGGDAETLGLLAALTENEILAASEAEQHRLRTPVMAYARLLHEEHGKNLVDTLALGQKLKVTPLETHAVDQLRRQGAAELTTVVTAPADQFSKTFVDARVKSHSDALALLDKQIAATTTAALKQHLTETRGQIARHLEQAKKLQT